MARALDVARLASEARRLAPGLSGFAVTGRFAALNPAHEVAARDILRRETGLPVTCGHELTSRLDGANFSAQVYNPSHGADLYRRTMYTFWKRTSPPPSLMTFDAPDRETCTVRRARTNTPLQALVLLNDPTYVEAARTLAERLMTEGGADPAARITLAFRLATARKPRAPELSLLQRLFEEQWSSYRAEPAAALKLLHVGESPRNERLDVPELAAWTVIASWPESMLWLTPRIVDAGPLAVGAGAASTRATGAGAGAAGASASSAAAGGGAGTSATTAGASVLADV